ncbi:MAG: hypothetical protein ACPGQS_05525 [Bradymonadia bacterium]
MITRILTLCTIALFGCTKAQQGDVEAAASPSKTNTTSKSPSSATPNKVAEGKSNTREIQRTATSPSAQTTTVKKIRLPFSAAKCRAACEARTDGSRKACLRRCKTSETFLGSPKPTIDLTVCKAACTQGTPGERAACLNRCNPRESTPKTSRSKTSTLKLPMIKFATCSKACRAQNGGTRDACMRACKAAAGPATTKPKSK